MRAGLLALLGIGGVLGAAFALLVYVSTRGLTGHPLASALGLLGAAAGTFSFLMAVGRWSRRQRDHDAGR